MGNLKNNNPIKFCFVCGCDAKGPASFFAKIYILIENFYYPNYYLSRYFNITVSFALHITFLIHTCFL